MSNVIRFRPRSEPKEIYKTEPADIDDILDLVRGRLKNVILIGIDEDNNGLVATYPGVLDRDEVIEVFELVQELVFGHERYS
jgi:hypothetical protein